MRTLLSAFTGLISAVFIICAAVVITLNCRLLYEADIDRYGLSEVTNLTKDEILENYEAMIDYNNLNGPDELAFPDFKMSDEGRIHFEEVRRIFHFIEYAAMFCGAVTAAAIAVSKTKKLYSYRLWTGLFTAALPFAAAIGALCCWDRLFVLFHRLLFSNDYWIFDSALDPVITILPDEYFLHCLIMITLISFFGAAVFFIWYSKGKNGSRRTKMPSRE